MASASSPTLRPSPSRKLTRSYSAGYLGQLSSSVSQPSRCIDRDTPRAYPEKCSQLPQMQYFKGSGEPIGVKMSKVLKGKALAEFEKKRVCHSLNLRDCWAFLCAYCKGDSRAESSLAVRL